MEIPKFEVIKTENGLQLVSDAGHKHYKPAIEMLLASEMFIKHNLYLIPYYRRGLAIIERGSTSAGEMLSPRATPYLEYDYTDTVSQHLSKCIKEVLYANKELISLLKEPINKLAVTGFLRLNEIVQLIDKVHSGRYDEDENNAIKENINTFNEVFELFKQGINLTEPEHENQTQPQEAV